MTLMPFYPREQKPISQFTIYSEDGQAAIHCEHHKGGKVSLETRGGLMLDKEQLQSLRVWLGMDLGDQDD